MDQAPMPGQPCKCPHHMMGPFFIVLIGVVFLLHELGVFSDRSTNILWPTILMAFGFHKMVGSSCKCRSRH